MKGVLPNLYPSSFQIFAGAVDTFLEGLAGVEAGEVGAEADEGAGDAGAVP